MNLSLTMVFSILREVNISYEYWKDKDPKFAERLKVQKDRLEKEAGLEDEDKRKLYEEYLKGRENE